MVKYNLRAIVSISLFFLIIILFFTAIGIQILDEIIDPEKMIALQLNSESKQPYFLAELHHIITAVHVIAGFLFCVLSVIHIIKNWKLLKNHFIK